MPRGIPRKTTIQQACETFVDTLLEADSIEEESLFLTLNDVATKHGYILEARQQGIRGTFICFRNMK